MTDTAMMRLRAISSDAGKRVDYRMVSIDTFLSVGTASARLLGPERSCPDRTFLPHLRSSVCKGLWIRTTPCRPRIRAQSTALMETEVGALCVRMTHLAGMDKRCSDGRQFRCHHRKAHESAGALIGAPLRADS